MIDTAQDLKEYKKRLKNALHNDFLRKTLKNSPLNMKVFWPSDKFRIRADRRYPASST